MWEFPDYLKTVKIGPKLWMLLEDFSAVTPRGCIIVPAGYLTDHASVPRVFHSVCAPAATPVAEASIIHDWLYNKDSEDLPREFADLCLRELSLENGASRTLAYTVWSAVRVGGRGLYNKEYYRKKLINNAYDELKYASPEFLLEAFK